MHCCAGSACGKSETWIDEDSNSTLCASCEKPVHAGITCGTFLFFDTWVCHPCYYHRRRNRFSSLSSLSPWLRQQQQQQQFKNQPKVETRTTRKRPNMSVTSNSADETTNENGARKRRRIDSPYDAVHSMGAVTSGGPSCPVSIQFLSPEKNWMTTATATKPKQKPSWFQMVSHTVAHAIQAVQNTTTTTSKPNAATAVHTPLQRRQRRTRTCSKQIKTPLQRQLNIRRYIDTSNRADQKESSPHNNRNNNTNNTNNTNNNNTNTYQTGTTTGQPPISPFSSWIMGSTFHQATQKSLTVSDATDRDKQTE